MTMIVTWESLTPQGYGMIWGVEPLNQKLHLPTYDSPGGSTSQRFHFLLNDLDHLFFICYVFNDDLQSRGRGFNSQLGRYQVVAAWMGDCLRTGKPSHYITNTNVNSAFHPSGVGKSSTGLHGWG